MSAALLLLAALAQPAAPDDEAAAVLYMQSRMVPASFAVCAEFHPRSARDYDAALAGWRLRNQPAIDRGERPARAQVPGQDLDAVLAAEAKRLQDEIRGLPADERTRLCERLLRSMRDDA